MLHWALTLVLAAFVVAQARSLTLLQRRIDNLVRTLDDLRRNPAPLKPRAQTTAPVSPPAPVAELRPPVRAATPPPPVEPARAIPPALRTPVDDWSISDNDPAPRPEPRRASRPEPHPEHRPSSDLSWTALSTWLAENGLAWLGGGGLALGGLLLVVYAAQQGVFGPPLRVAAAVALGALMIGASEWILRQKRAPGGRHLLAAAVSAGAGAVTLYGAVCAAYTLYGMIAFPVAALLTAAISVGLLALSLRHGEPLALLALFGAVITPWVTGVGAWPTPVLFGYVLLIGVTGFGMSAVRLWAKAGLLTVIGLLIWSLSHRFDGGAALLLLAATGPLAAVLWRRKARSDDPEAPSSALFRHQPAVALILTSLTGGLIWLMSPVAHLPEAILVAGVLVALGAGLVVTGLATPAIFAVPVIVAVIGALMTLAFQPPPLAALPWLYGLMGVIVIATLVGALRSAAATRTTMLTIGGVSLAVLATLSWPLLDRLDVILPWLPAALLSAGMFATAPVIAQRVEQPATDKGLVFWLGGAAQLAFLSIHASVPAHLEAVAFALAALLLGAAASRLKWRGLAQITVVGGMLTLVVLFRPAFVNAALEGRLSLPLAMAISIGAAAVVYFSARLMRGQGGADRNAVEAQTTAALLTLLTGLFIGLHVLLSGVEAGVASGELFAAAMRTLLLLSAGLLLVTQRRTDEGPIATWRAILLTGAGVLHGVMAQGLFLNPWWGLGEAPVGLPVLNTLILSFLAPAALLALSARRRTPVDGWTRIWAVAGALFAFLWVLMVLRHLFHGADMSEAGIGLAESAAYAVLFLLTARLISAAAKAEWTRTLGVGLSWIALTVSALVFGYGASPWWGPQNTPMSSLPHVLLLLGLYAAGAGLAFGMRSRPDGLGKGARAVTVGILFVLLTLVIRAVFHGVAMHDAAPGSGLETWTFSTLWTAFGLATLSLGTIHRDATLRWAGLIVLLATAVKVLFFDLSQLEGIVRAASFLVVGALLLAGALAARRLSRGRPASDGTDPP
ncbi:DUF2339 domain-containing protein [Brevundimonas sp. GCM10030266]|uniref:DUF2339 domain-containing protein n=1 Tax=Brevundimonas sp. GCM10030266 TaxID=3273386 RepID=UPI003607CA1B